MWVLKTTLACVLLWASVKAARLAVMIESANAQREDYNNAVTLIGIVVLSLALGYIKRRYVDVIQRSCIGFAISIVLLVQASSMFALGDTWSLFAASALVALSILVVGWTAIEVVNSFSEPSDE
jgi:hypothetical protein